MSPLDAFSPPDDKSRHPAAGEPRSIHERSDAVLSPDDGALLARIQQGDQDAMAVVFDRYSRLVYSVALRVLHDTGTAEDLLQDVFMQIWRKPGSFLSTRGSLGSWLAVVARNRAIDVLRRRKPTDDMEDMVLASSFNLAAESERTLMMERARGIMEVLPGAQRRVLEMAYFEGMTHTEIAAQTGDPLGTVKTRIRSALLVLRKAMQP